jgi:hydrogenase maturation protein HypF
MPPQQSDPPSADGCAPAVLEQTLALRIELKGRVQGLGVRPAIARLAEVHRLAGYVRNSAQGVTIHIEGPATAALRFQQSLLSALPLGAEATLLAAEATDWIGLPAFSIARSTLAGALATQVPPDRAVCEACLAEVASPGNQRHDYLLTTCTVCGPRYALIRSMPYDREATEMRGFEQCPLCLAEYLRPADRRHHSQTNSCPQCGPRLWLSDVDGSVESHLERIVPRAIVALRQGCIVALRGVGGYQLLADARSPQVVGLLRRRKLRSGKPLAVLVANLTNAERLASIDAGERQLLASPANPIVVVPARTPSAVAAEVSEGLDTLGIMLPTTPLHYELARAFGGPLIVTSGNLEGDPLAFEADAARQRLGDIVDAWLDHDRPIARPCDDSVVRMIAGQAASLRLGRGLAPLPLPLNCRPLLALGGHQKAAISLSNGVQSILGPHVGTLDSDATRARYLEQIEALCQLYDARPEMIVCDEHPDYFSTRWAAEQSLPGMRVQHHHAHVVAGMLEPGWLDRQVLGVAWDGTGYGPDGTIWGGEFLIADAVAYRRVGCLRSFVLPGGEAAVRQPWRVAVSLVYQAAGPEAASKLVFPGVDQGAVGKLASLLNRARIWPTTTSAGRLFDGVAALALGITTSAFEGQPAMRLEAACDPLCDGQYPLPLHDGPRLTLDWRPLIRAVLVDVRSEVSRATIAMRFHRALAAGVVAACAHFSLPVVLCGGCFYNKILTELVRTMLPCDRAMATPGVIPAGDGGLSAGQLAIGGARMAQGRTACA